MRQKYRKNPWLIPFVMLVIVMAVSMMAILQAASQSSQDIRSRAFDDVREVPNRQIPRITGVLITGVPASTRAPLLYQSPGPTPSISPTPRQQPPCNVVLQFMRIPCRVP